MARPVLSDPLDILAPCPGQPEHRSPQRPRFVRQDLTGNASSGTASQTFSPGSASTPDPPPETTDLFGGMPERPGSPQP